MLLALNSNSITQSTFLASHKHVTLFPHSPDSTTRLQPKKRKHLSSGLSISKHNLSLDESNAPVFANYHVYDLPTVTIPLMLNGRLDTRSQHSSKCFAKHPPGRKGRPIGRISETLHYLIPLNVYLTQGAFLSLGKGMQLELTLWRLTSM